MSVVYQHQLHGHAKRHRARKWVWLGVVLLLLLGGFIGWHQLKPDTKITNARAVTKQISGNSSTKTWHEGIFSIALPKGWTFVREQKDIYDIFHFKGPVDASKGNRLLDVYQDSQLPNFAVNRMIPVEATDDGKLNASTADVSENCTNYTTGSTSSRGTVAQQAKWQNIIFLCDMSNTLRNVIGTGSKDGLNTVIVKSMSTGVHHFFLTYTENNDKPDYSIFVAALNSFQVDQ